MKKPKKETVQIIINGRSLKVAPGRVHYNTLVTMAFPTTTFPVNAYHDITYRNGPAENRKGALHSEHDTVMLGNGMAFSLALTNRS